MSSLAGIATATATAMTQLSDAERAQKQREEDAVDAAAAPQHMQFECSICFDVSPDFVVTLCGHLFCWPCLFRWLKQKHECPVCKARVSRQSVIPVYGSGRADQALYERRRNAARSIGSADEAEADDDDATTAGAMGENKTRARVSSIPQRPVAPMQRHQRAAAAARNNGDGSISSGAARSASPASSSSSSLASRRAVSSGRSPASGRAGDGSNMRSPGGTRRNANGVTAADAQAAAAVMMASGGAGGGAGQMLNPSLFGLQFRALFNEANSDGGADGEFRNADDAKSARVLSWILRLLLIACVACWIMF
jgi:hypothetical protein